MKISEEKIKEGRVLAAKNGYKRLFVNAKGEFFTDKGCAAMSVKNDLDMYAELPLSGDLSDTGAEKGTNDLGKAADVITSIEEATEVVVVEAILEAENQGKKRKSVIDAAVKKIEALNKKSE